MKRLGPLFILCVALLAALVRPMFAEEADQPALPAKAYLLMDAKTGQVLIHHEGDMQLPIASTTKIMTAVLAFERGMLTDVVTVGQKPYDTGGSTIWLDIGEQQTLEDLLYALMLESANDAAVAIAEHLAGSEEAFAAWMNEKAREIGATRTHFTNSHGLHDPAHYSTAHDLALIARYAMQNERFRALVTTEERTIPGFKATPPRRLLNRNQLLGYYEGANGVKNGFTEEAGMTNVASARRGDLELIAVVLGAESRLWTSSMALLDWGFRHVPPSQDVEIRKDNQASPGVAPDAVPSTAPPVSAAPAAGESPPPLPFWAPTGAMLAALGLTSGLHRSRRLVRRPYA